MWIAAILGQAALACGGLFCDNSPPPPGVTAVRVDQSEERIVFTVTDDCHIEANVQIFYEGDAAEFAWVVPVPTLPEVGISADALFNVVDLGTRPFIQWSSTEQGRCEWHRGDDETDWEFETETEAETETEGEPPGGGVVVIAQQQVGPYDQTTLQASSPAALLEWLEANEYYVPEDIGVPIAPYVQGGAYFVALKLHSGRTSGDISPIKLSYEGCAPGIPLILTAIAAREGMPISTFILTEGRRAVPDNYLHVQLNPVGWEELYDLQHRRRQFQQALDEAGGQAFVTDYSGPADVLRGALPESFSRQRLRAADGPITFITELDRQRVPATPALIELLKVWIPLPPDAPVTPEVFYACPSCYPEIADAITMDTIGATEAIDAAILLPNEEAAALFVRFSALTALRTEMSPAEMTVDPMFALNDVLPRVPRATTVIHRTDCRVIHDPELAPRWLDMSVTSFREPPQWSGFPAASWREQRHIPAALIIEDLGPSGLGTVIADNTASTRQAVDAWNQSFLNWQTALPPDEDAVSPSTETTAADCGCNGAPSTALVGLLAALLPLRRHRTRKPMR